MRFTTAIGVSIALHGVLAMGLVACMKYAPGPATLATLDISSVELSFAEEDAEAAVAAPFMPSPPPYEPPKPPEVKPPEPEVERPEGAPPDPEAVEIPEPGPERERMESPAPAPAPAVAPKQAKVDAPPRPKRAIRPEYPTGARQRGEQGDVVVEMLVNEHGAVDHVAVVSSCGFPELDEAAAKAVKKARFTPAKSGRKTVASTARLTLTFKLR